MIVRPEAADEGSHGTVFRVLTNAGLGCGVMINDWRGNYVCKLLFLSNHRASERKRMSVRPLGRLSRDRRRHAVGRRARRGVGAPTRTVSFSGRNVDDGGAAARWWLRLMRARTTTWRSLRFWFIRKRVKWNSSRCGLRNQIDSYTTEFGLTKPIRISFFLSKQFVTIGGYEMSMERGENVH